MSKPHRVVTSPLHRAGVAGSALVRVFRGSGAPETSGGVGASAARVGGLVLAGLISALVCLGVCVAPAFALEGYEPGTPASFGEPGTGNGQFNEPVGVAVNDATNDVYVVDKGNNRVEYFNSMGTYIGQFSGNETPAGSFSAPDAIAIDNDALSPSHGDVYVVDRGHDVVDKFEEEAPGKWRYVDQLSETLTGAFAGIGGVTVDSNGNVWVLEYEGGKVDEFSSGGSYTGGFEDGYGHAHAIAADPDGDLFIARAAPPLGEVEVWIETAGTWSSAEFAPVNGNAQLAEALAVDPSTDSVLVDQLTDIELWDTSETLIQKFPSNGLAESDGVAASASALYATQRVADTVEVFGFGPLKPAVEGESVSGVGSSSATLHGQVHPYGEVTSYFFEYGPTAAYGSRTPVESAGAGSGSVSVSATIEGPSLEGLQPDTAYHFRLAASNANGIAHGGDGSFSTLPVGLLGLPDGRGYELVSPLEDGNATVVFYGAPVRAAADGNAVAYQGTAPPVGGNGNGGNSEGSGLTVEADNAYLAERSTSGWTATDIQPDGLNSAGYMAFSGELSVGILGSEQAVTPGGPSGEGHTGLYAREEGGGYRLLGENVTYAGSTPEGSHLLVGTSPNRLEEVEPVTGKSYPVNVLPGGGSAADAVFGSPRRHDSEGTVSISMIGPDLDNVISSDGSRVFWTETDGEGNPLRLFVSEDVGSAGERTVQLDASRVHGNTGGGGRFAAASRDGSRVFFTDCNQLTPGSTAVPTPDCEREVVRGGQSEARETPAGDDLYEYDLETGTLTDLTVASGVEHANAVGVLGASEDGAYVYFAAAGALAAGASPQECVQRTFDDVGTECNVYVVHDGGAPEFVATVTSGEWADWATLVGAHSAYVAPVGGQLVFESTLNLTAFDSRGVDEIYRYIPGSGISCVSCNPSGAVTPPGGGARLLESSSATYALRDVSASGGRVFFETAENLVSRDQNGLSDVYEWEAPGEGGCGSGDSAYSAANGGCLYLLSSGTSSAASVFMDASESGDDVFIETRADLVPRDRSEAIAVYDVRVGATAPPVEPQCTGTGCQGVPAAPPIFATPSSVTFNGVGNFPPPTPVKTVTKKTVKCAKGKKLSKGRCVKTKPKPKRKQSGAKKSTHRKGSK